MKCTSSKHYSLVQLKAEVTMQNAASLYTPLLPHTTSSNPTWAEMMV